MKRLIWRNSGRLRAEVALHRYGWAPVVLLALAACSASFQWGSLALMHEQEAALRAQLEVVSQAHHAIAPEAAVRGPASPLLAVQAVLPAPGGINRQVDRIFLAAERQGLRLERSEFQYETLRTMPWTRVSITLPVSGSYPAVRSFLEATLREEPNMALDQLSIKRELPADPRASVQLGFSAWFQASSTQAKSPGSTPR